MTKAFCYLRVSGDSQVDGDGFPRQLAATKAHAKQHGYRIVRTFREEGVTGAKETMDRPAWQEMMTALHSNDVKTIIIEKLDRLARSLLIQEAAIAELAKQGFALVSVCEPELMSDDPWRKAFRQMMGVFSELDKNQIVLKLRGARMRKRAATGRCEGRKPYGFREGEQQVLERMKRWRAEGASLNRIADQLNAEQVPTRSGQRWHPYTVSKILSRATKAV
jgi:DNA invertase Pin-like site-specific DNA recombinase